MFWWGNFFSVTLHLSGDPKTRLQEKILKNIALLDQQGFFLCINENEWEHHFETENYKKISDLTLQEIEERIYKMHFLKIAIKYPIHQMETMEDDLCGNYKILIDLFH